MVLLHQRIAERALDAPQREQRAALDAEIALDACEQRRVITQGFLAGDDAPVGHAAIDIFPEMFVEFRLCCICLNTVMSGSMWPIARTQVRSEMPRAIARGAELSGHDRSLAEWRPKPTEASASIAPTPSPARRQARRVSPFRESRRSHRPSLRPVRAD